MFVLRSAISVSSLLMVSRETNEIYGFIFVMSDIHMVKAIVIVLMGYLWPYTTRDAYNCFVAFHWSLFVLSQWELFTLQLNSFVESIVAFTVSSIHWNIETLMLSKFSLKWDSFLCKKYVWFEQMPNMYIVDIVDSISQHNN